MFTLILSFFLIWTCSCQGLNYGMHPRTMLQAGGLSQSMKSDLDEGWAEDNDPVGTWIFVTIAAAAAISAGVLVPLYINEKL